MGQTAGDLGWREFEARAGGRGVGVWLRLGRGGEHDHCGWGPKAEGLQCGQD